MTAAPCEVQMTLPTINVENAVHFGWQLFMWRLS